MRLLGQRQPDRAKALQALKDSFELYQQVLTVVSKDTAPNHWAMLCDAELGHTLVAALPLLSEHDRKKKWPKMLLRRLRRRVAISSPVVLDRT
jgi:hypothetical protein